MKKLTDCFKIAHSVVQIQYAQFSANRLNNGQLAPALQKRSLGSFEHRFIILIHPERYLVLGA